MQSGTGNLGTTNAFIHFGKGWGLFVLAFDMGKAITAVKLCEWLFPGMILTGIAAGCFAVIGHMFPVYTNFRSGVFSYYYDVSVSARRSIRAAGRLQRVHDLQAYG